MYKIAIVGASTLLGKELKEAIAESPLAVASVVLLDDEASQGQLDQIGDEVTFLQTIDTDAFDRVDFTFFCGSEDMTQKYWKLALSAGSSVLDLSGALDREADVIVRSPWLGSVTAPDLSTAAIVPAHPAALALALLLERLQQVVPVRSVATTLLVPASEFGRDALDELHQQTINLLSFQSQPRAVFDTQIAFNLLCGLGENATANLRTLEERVRRHYTFIGGGRWPEPALHAVQAPVFHGNSFAIAVELERRIEIARLEEVFSGQHVDLILEDTDSPSNLSATGQSDVLVRMRPERAGERNPNEATRIWLWAAVDNLRLHAANAIECALELSRLRPRGAVQ